MPPEPAGRRRRSRRLGKLWEQWGIALVLLALAVIAAVLDPGFMSVSNIQSILRESAYVGIAAAGMTIAIMNGTFDLSVGGQLALVSSISLMGYSAGGTFLAWSRPSRPASAAGWSTASSSRACSSRRSWRP